MESGKRLTFLTLIKERIVSDYTDCKKCKKIRQREEYYKRSRNYYKQKAARVWLLGSLKLSALVLANILFALLIGGVCFDWWMRFYS